MGLVGAPERRKKIQEAHPDVDIYLAALDEKLNEKGYIVPGLGDCGDRLSEPNEANQSLCINCINFLFC